MLSGRSDNPLCAFQNNLSLLGALQAVYSNISRLLETGDKNWPETARLPSPLD